MKETLNIGGKDITFEATVFTLDLYNREFGRDLLADSTIMGSAMSSLSKKNFDPEKLKDLDMTIILKAAWACAKTADESIPGYREWLKEVPEFSVLTDGMEITKLALNQLMAKKK